MTGTEQLITVYCEVIGARRQLTIQVGSPGNECHKSDDESDLFN